MTCGKDRTGTVANYCVYIWQYGIKCINEENLEKAGVNGGFREAFMKENLIWALR